MSQQVREWIAVTLTAILIIGLWVALLFAITGCAGPRLFKKTVSEGGALGIATQHCAAYGPLKTTRADKNNPPKIRFGAAVVCEK